MFLYKSPQLEILFFLLLMHPYLGLGDQGTINVIRPQKCATGAITREITFLYGNEPIRSRNPWFYS